MSAIEELHHFNELSAAEDERLALLLEECGEAVHIIGKILRHGYESYHPDNPQGPSNREMLEKELGDVEAAIDLLIRATDLNGTAIDYHRREKHKKVGKYMHHQNEHSRSKHG